MAVMSELIAVSSQLVGFDTHRADAYVARSALLRMRRTLGPKFGLEIPAYRYR